MRRDRLSIPAAASASAILAVVLLSLWIRSGRVGDSILYAATDRYFVLKSVDGTVYFGVIEQHHQHSPDPRWIVFDLDPGFHAFFGWSFRGLSPQAYFGVGPETNPLWTLSLSYWLLVIASSVIPSVWLYRSWVRRRTRQIGVCLQCGYNLRGTIAGGRDVCPECGTQIEQMADN